MSCYYSSLLGIELAFPSIHQRSNIGVGLACTIAPYLFFYLYTISYCLCLLFLILILMVLPFSLCPTLHPSSSLLPSLLPFPSSHPPFLPSPPQVRHLNRVRHSRLLRQCVPSLTTSWMKWTWLMWNVPYFDAARNQWLSEAPLLRSCICLLRCVCGRGGERGGSCVANCMHLPHTLYVTQVYAREYVQSQDCVALLHILEISTWSL